MENPFELILEKLTNIKNQLKELKENQKQEIQNDLMDIIELGKYINFKKTSIYGLVQKPKIPYIKASGKLHFHKKDIDKWLNESKKMSREEIENKANEYVARN